MAFPLRLAGRYISGVARCGLLPGLNGVKTTPFAPVCKPNGVNIPGKYLFLPFLVHFMSWHYYPESLFEVDLIFTSMIYRSLILYGLNVLNYTMVVEPAAGLMVNNIFFVHRQ